MAESMSEQIFSIACALSKADESEKSMLRMICTAQEESLVRALKEGVAKEDCESAFICAASWLAAAALESARAGGEEFSSLRAGDLTVTKRSSDEGSKRLSMLREQAWALSAHGTCVVTIYAQSRYIRSVFPVDQRRSFDL